MWYNNVDCNHRQFYGLKFCTLLNLWDKTLYHHEYKSSVQAGLNFADSIEHPQKLIPHKIIIVCGYSLFRINSPFMVQDLTLSTGTRTVSHIPWRLL